MFERGAQSEALPGFAACSLAMILAVSCQPAPPPPVVTIASATSVPVTTADAGPPPDAGNDSGDAADADAAPADAAAPAPTFVSFPEPRVFGKVILQYREHEGGGTTLVEEISDSRNFHRARTIYQPEFWREVLPEALEDFRRELIENGFCTLPARPVIMHAASIELTVRMRGVSCTHLFMRDHLPEDPRPAACIKAYRKLEASACGGSCPVAILGRW